MFSLWLVDSATSKVSSHQKNLAGCKPREISSDFSSNMAWQEPHRRHIVCLASENPALPRNVMLLRINPDLFHIYTTIMTGPISLLCVPVQFKLLNFYWTLTARYLLFTYVMQFYIKKKTFTYYVLTLVSHTQIISNKTQLKNSL